MRRGIPKGKRSCPAGNPDHLWHDPNSRPYRECRAIADGRTLGPPRRPSPPQQPQRSRASHIADMPRQRDRRTPRDPSWPPTRRERSPQGWTESNRHYARRTNKEELSFRRDVSATTLEYVFDRDGFYESLADRLIDTVPFRRKRRHGHWLCEQLDGTAEALDPETYRKIVGQGVAEGLKALGMRDNLADVIGGSAGFGVKAVIGATTSIGHVSKVLRIVIPLVCPDITECPARAKVFAAYVGPTLTDTLKQIAEAGSSARRS